MGCICVAEEKIMMSLKRISLFPTMKTYALLEKKYRDWELG